MNRLKNELKEEVKHAKERLVEGVLLSPCSAQNLFEWKLVLSFPFADSIYHDHSYNVMIDIPQNYPLVPPRCRFETAIFHPNISADSGEICLNILKEDEWSISYSLYSIAISLIGLVNTPNCDSPLNLDAGNLYRSADLRAYKSMVNYFYHQ